MRFQLFILLTTVFAFFSNLASAQQFFSSPRTGKITAYHATVGTATAEAIPAASVGGGLVSWKICNDAENTSTHLLVGLASDVSTDGTMIGKGQCYECWNCTPALLKLMRVEAQAASNGYSVVQFRQ